MIGFWIFMALMVLLVPATMIGFGSLFLKRPPDKINSVFGYRTARSMKNRKTWEFAHNYLGRLWKRLGWFLLPVSLLPMILVLGAGAETVGKVGGGIVLLQLIPLVAPIFPTERALKREFDEFGRKR